MERGKKKGQAVRLAWTVCNVPKMDCFFLNEKRKRLWNDRILFRVSLRSMQRYIILRMIFFLLVKKTALPNDALALALLIMIKVGGLR